MAIIIIFLGCFLLYAKSKHFPSQFPKLHKKLKTKPIYVRLLSYLLFTTSALLLCYAFGLWTGLVIFTITLMFALTLTVMLLPLNKKYAYVLTILSLIVVLTEFFI